MTDIVHQYQPVNSSLCGQACIAMICGIHLADAVEAVGKASGTTGPDLAKALKILGVESSPKQVRIGKKLPRKSNYYPFLPPKCIAKVRSAGVKKYHWVLIWNGKTYDPYPGYVPWEYISGYIEIREAA